MFFLSVYCLEFKNFILLIINKSRIKKNIFENIFDENLD